MGLLETLTSASERACEARGWLVHEHAARFLEGVLEVKELEDGWVRPWRFTSLQRQALASCLAWHPGRFRQLSSCTAGVTLRFATDATEVAFAVRLDAISGAARAALRACGDERANKAQIAPTFAATASGEDLAVEIGVPYARALEWLEGSEGATLVSVTLSDERGPGGIATMVLPGFGLRREVEVWLPFERGLTIRDVWCDGTYLEPLAARDRLVVIGDASSAGFGAESAAGTWSARLARELNLELLNLSLAGQVFQPSMILDLGLSGSPHVVCSLGAGYAHERVAPGEAMRDARAFVLELRRRMDANACLDVIVPEVVPAEGAGAFSQPLTKGFWKEFAATLAAKASVGADVRLIEAGRLTDAGSGTLEMPTQESHLTASRRLAVICCGAAPKKMRTRALAILDCWGVRAVPVAAAIREGAAEVLYAAEGCVLANARGGVQLVCAEDASVLAEAATLYLETGVTDLYAVSERREDIRDLERALAKRLALSRRSCAHLVTFEGEGLLPPVEVPGEIRVLGAADLDAVFDHSRNRDSLNRHLLRQMLSEGRFLGAFEGERLVGFLGELPDGSVGPIEVVRSQRGKGWGCALETAKVNQLIEGGRAVRMLVYPRNKSSLALQEELGMRISTRADVVILSP